MDINATLIGQGITFFIFILITMKFVWPPIMAAMEERKQRIADGLAAGEQGQKDLEEAREKSELIIDGAREHARVILDKAQMRADEVVEQAKSTASSEGDRLVAEARARIEQESLKARTSLRNEVAVLAAAGAGKLLEREVDAGSHAKLFDELIEQL